MKKRADVKKRLITSILSLAMIFGMVPVRSLAFAADTPDQSAEQIEAVEGREKLNFNQGWKFVRRNIPEAIEVDYDMAELERWENVSLPHTVRVEPFMNSGGLNYQGEYMYRKHFVLDESFAGKQLFVEFEAIMHVGDIWVNGQHLQMPVAAKTGDRTFYGGYLPVILDITDYVHCDGQPNVITVLADNSDQPDVPPGKPQGELDFTYFGGIYRNAWLEVTEPVHITNANYEDVVAGGGVLVDYRNVSKEHADVYVKTHIRNEQDGEQVVTLQNQIVERGGNVVASMTSQATPIAGGEAQSIEQTLPVEDPNLWNIDNPYLYTLISTVLVDGVEVDRVETQIGIRTIEMTKDGIFINHEPAEFLSGVNRHQEYPYIGFAASSALQRKDAVKFKDAGFNVVRTAHHPQSVDFLNACDELGILVLEAIPGWQWFRDNDEFKNRVWNDIRQIVRRDRNHPCILTYEVVLNETYLEQGFTTKNEQVALEEHPSARVSSEGGPDDLADILYARDVTTVEKQSDHAVAFVREYGDWYMEQWGGGFASNARILRAPGEYYPGGEARMLLQANGRLFTNNEAIAAYSDFKKQYEESPRYAGGTMWIGIDHNRGYDPHDSPCGIWDLARLPKYSYYAFASQRDLERDDYLGSRDVDSGPLMFIASSWGTHAPVVDKFEQGAPIDTRTIGTDELREIYVYSNVDKVTLYVIKDGEVRWQATQDPMTEGETVYLDHAPFLFSEVPYEEGSYLLAEGYDAEGNMVTTQEVHTAGAPAQLKLEVDYEGMDLIADGSDAVMVYAYVLDSEGNVCTEASNQIHFSISGPGSIVGDGDKRVNCNPVNAAAGIVGIYVQAGTEAGSITLKAESDGLQAGEVVIQSAPLTARCVDFVEIAQGTPIENSSMFLADKDCIKVGQYNEYSKLTATIDGQEYEKSLEMLDGEAYEYDLDGAYSRFTSGLAVKDAPADGAGTRFKVYLDGTLRYVSDPVKSGVVQLDMDVTGARTMRIVAQDEDVMSNRTVYWLSPYLFEGANPPDESELRNNLALNGTATADSAIENTNAGMAVDGDESTYWRSEEVGAGEDAKPQAWMVDLGEPKNIRNARVGLKSDSFDYTYEIYTSKDGQAWDLQVTTKKSGQAGNQLDLFTAQDVRYVKVRFIEAPGNAGRGQPPCGDITEFEVYEDKGVDSVNEYNLKGLAIGGHEFVFDPSKTAYEIDAKASDLRLSLRALPQDGEATVTVNGKPMKTLSYATDLYENDPFYVEELDENGNIVVEVTAANGIGKKVYTIHVNGTFPNGEYINANEAYVPNENGASGWFYQYYNQSTGEYVTMEPEDFTYMKGNPVWQGPGNWTYSGPLYIHPSVGYQAVRTYVVSKDAMARLDLNAKKLYSQGGLVGIQVRLNGQKVWPLDQDWATFNASSSISDLALYLNVKQGDQIQIALDCQGDNGQDATYLDTTVRYVDGVEIGAFTMQGPDVIKKMEDQKNSAQYCVNATAEDGTIVVSPCQWEIETELEGITVDESGLVSVSAQTGAGTFKLIAKERDTGNVMAEKEISVEVTKIGEITYVSDMEWVSSTCGWETIQRDQSIEFKPISVCDENGKVKTFDKGVGTHANSEIVLDIEGLGFDTFSTYVGQDAIKNHYMASITAQIWVDGEMVYETEVLKQNSPAAYIEVPVTGAKQVKLVITDGGDGNGGDNANWADTKFTKNA